MLRSTLLPVAAAVLALHSGCATHPASPCRAGETPSVDERLYFGTAKPGGVVTPAEWAAFLATSVTPRFPAGLTVWPAAGQWRSDQGAIVQEASFVLNLVYPPGDPQELAVRALVAEYKQQFRQEAVLRVRWQGCVSL